MIRWIDGTTLEYKYFKKGEPDNAENKNCLQLIANRDLLNAKDESSLGKWSNTECERHNFNVLCQKTQKITFDRLTEIVFSLKKKYEKEKNELKDTIAEMKTKEFDLERRVEELEKNETVFINKINEMVNNETNFKNEIISLNKQLTNEINSIKGEEILLKEDFRDIILISPFKTTELCFKILSIICNKRNQT